MANFKKIIVLDDDPTFCYLIRREFRKQKIEVFVCDEVGTFANYLKSSKFDLAVIDYSLDGITGIQVAQCVPGLNVLLISRTSTWVEQQREKFSKNVMGFIHKKFGPKVLTAEILRYWSISIGKEGL